MKPVSALELLAELERFERYLDGIPEGERVPVSFHPTWWPTVVSYIAKVETTRFKRFTKWEFRREGLVHYRPVTEEIRLVNRAELRKRVFKWWEGLHE